MRSFPSIDVPLLNSKIFLFRSLKRSKTFLPDPLATLITIESFWLFCTPSYINLVSDYRSSCLETGSSFQLRFFNFPLPEFGESNDSLVLISRLSYEVAWWVWWAAHWWTDVAFSRSFGHLIVNHKLWIKNAEWWIANGDSQLWLLITLD